MIARLRRLGDRGLAIRLQAGEQQRRLHLRAGDVEDVRRAVQRSSVDDERRAAVAARAADRRSHARERIGDTPHRPASERGIAVEPTRERTAREDTAEEAHGGARVAAIDRLRRRHEAVPAAPVDAQLVAALVDDDTERAARGLRRLIVLAPRKTPYGRLAAGDRAEEERAVRDRLVARHRDRAAQRPARGRDRDRTHGFRARAVGRRVTVPRRDPGRGAAERRRRTACARVSSASSVSRSPTSIASRRRASAGRNSSIAQYLVAIGDAEVAPHLR